MVSIPCVICAARPQAIRLIVLSLDSGHFGRSFQRRDFTLSLLQFKAQLSDQFV
ncbi:hypothetical protein PG5_41560 [Pseudomonas sp. G5(2012)]|nr:hypothetical protein PG5_41560 [Pseudomonas sp. G5(2012)]